LDEEKAARDLFIHIFCWDCDSRMAGSRLECQAGSLQFGFQIAEMSQHISNQLPQCRIPELG
jgi:hypothetical protein